MIGEMKRNLQTSLKQHQFVAVLIIFDLESFVPDAHFNYKQHFFSLCVMTLEKRP